MPPPHLLPLFLLPSPPELPVPPACPASLEDTPSLPVFASLIPVPLDPPFLGDPESPVVDPLGVGPGSGDVRHSPPSRSAPTSKSNNCLPPTPTPSVSFLFSFFYFPFFSSSPMSASSSRDWDVGFSLWALIPFIFFTLLTFLSLYSLLLALMRADPALAGMRYMNK